jgi:hypothetical protein
MNTSGYSPSTLRRSASRMHVTWVTAFGSTRMREDGEVKRAMLAKKICEAEHGPAHEEFVRIIEGGEIEQ